MAVTFTNIGNSITTMCTEGVDKVKSTVRSAFSSNKKSVQAYNQIKMRNIVDKRVSLNVTPLSRPNETFADRVLYVLGSRSKQIYGSNLYGFLYSCLNGSTGLIFPYTPDIGISHSVSYEKTDILHSNISLNHYKNTPPPTYQVTAQFTADTRENAKHMLSAIWFLRAVTKCDFGEKANARGVAGMPPPILYLNGYNKMLDNIPVVVESFGYSLPKDKDYVLLDINLDSSTQEFTNYLYSDADTGKFYDTLQSMPSDGNNSSIRYVNGQPIKVDNLMSDKTAVGVNYNNKFLLSNWLPTELTISLSLKVQPNQLKVKKQFDLNEYKMGLMFLDASKNGSYVYEPTTFGELQQVSSQQMAFENTNQIAQEQRMCITKTDLPKKDTITFDKSGWTW